ncbi:unnamed protein product [marine sediment metagenome]|uniref:Uncharacterized protein n=1 Tax=marine sediment metagenome TaxID=412755 RepID=X1L6Q6_9ZZZZ
MNVAKTAMKGVTYYDPSKADDGYTLFGTWDGGNSDVWLIDMEGKYSPGWSTNNPSRLHIHILFNANNGASYHP